MPSWTHFSPLGHIWPKLKVSCFLSKWVLTWNNVMAYVQFWVARVNLSCHGNKISTATNTAVDCYFPKGHVTKYEVYKPSSSKVKQVCLCCHGNWIPMATSQSMGCCCLKESVYQIWSSFTFKQQRYMCCMCICCHGNKVSIAASNKMNSCCLKGSVYQIKTSYIFKQRSYKRAFVTMVTRFPQY